MHIFSKHWNSSSLRERTCTTRRYLCCTYLCFFFFPSMLSRQLCFYLTLSLFPPNPREVEEIWFANNQGHSYCWAVEVAAHGAMWMALQTKRILPWTITCPAAIGCWVILLMMPGKHYISRADKGSVNEALTALWISVQTAGVPKGNKHHVLMDKSSKCRRLW